ncbi:MAG: helix-turn-helix domain-containing protein [Phycisphaeraceae bacterium]
MPEHSPLDELERFGRAIAELAAALKGGGGTPLEAPIKMRFAVTIGPGSNSSTTAGVTDVEAAERLGVPVGVARGLVRCGAIRGSRRRGGFVLSRASLVSYQAKIEAGSEPADAIPNATEAAAWLGVERATLYRLRKSGRVACRRRKKEVTFRLSDIESLLASADGELGGPERRGATTG